MTAPITALKAHVGINVRNVEASLAFYRKMFGLEPSKVRTGYAKFDVQNPPLNFTLNEVPSLDSAGALSHMGIQLSTIEEVIAYRDQWASAGLEPREEIGTDCCYARQNKAWVSDPDGNEWEAFVVLEDNLAQVTKASPSCACATA